MRAAQVRATAARKALRHSREPTISVAAEFTALHSGSNGHANKQTGSSRSQKERLKNAVMEMAELNQQRLMRNSRSATARIYAAMRSGVICAQIAGLDTKAGA